MKLAVVSSSVGFIAMAGVGALPNLQGLAENAPPRT
jgi:hypothetical protein